MKGLINEFIIKLEKVLDNDLPEEEFENLQSEVSDMEEQISGFFPRNGAEEKLLMKLEKLFSRVKEEYEFYDKDTELNMMFPNREDDDFDEDEIGGFVN